MEPLSGEEKSAILLGSLPPESVEQVLAVLDPGLSLRLRTLISNQEEAPQLDQLQAIYDELSVQTSPEAGLEMAGGEPGVVPEDEPEDGLDHDGNPVDFDQTDDPVADLKEVPLENLVVALEKEQPQTVALILGQLDERHAQEVLQRQEEDRRREIIVRLAHEVQAQPVVLREIARTVTRNALEVKAEDQGLDEESRYQKVADLLHSLDREERLASLQAIHDADPETAELVAGYLYQFEDVMIIADRSLQTILGQVELKDLATALAEMSAEYVERVTGNLSDRQGKLLASEMEFLGPVSANEIRQAKQTVERLIRQQDQDGKLVWTEQRFSGE